MFGKGLRKTVIDPDCREQDITIASPGSLHLAADAILADGDFDNPVFSDGFDKLTVGDDLRAKLIENQVLQEQDAPNGGKQIPDVEFCMVLHGDNRPLPGYGGVHILQRTHGKRLLRQSLLYSRYLVNKCKNILNHLRREDTE